MTYHHSLLDFDDCGPVTYDATAVKKPRGCSKCERIETPSGQKAVAAPEPLEPKAWTAQEIALATFWVAG